MSLDFTWKGATASSKGIHVEELPLPAIPAQRTVITEIEGRDGAIIESLGYSAYEKVIKIALPRSGYNMGEITAWLQGSGYLILSNEDAFYYRAHIVKPTDFTRLLRFRRASVAFYVQPYKYAVAEANVTGTASATVINAGPVASPPLITVTGIGNVTVTVGGKSVSLAMGPSAQIITLNCESGEAYAGRTNKNSIVTGKLTDIKLATGSNTVSTTGTVTAIVVTPQSRWL